MSQDLTKTDQQTEMERVVVDKKTLEDFLFTSDTKLTEKQKALFVQLAVRNQLDPFKREIYAIPYGNEFNIVTGYEVYLKRAERSGKLSGWRVWTEGHERADLRAIIEIHRNDWKEPLIHEVFFSEYDLGRSLWKTKPITMIKKVAIAQGFRLAFPAEIGGMPYTADELPSSSAEKEERKESEAPLEKLSPAQQKKIATMKKEGIEAGAFNEKQYYEVLDDRYKVKHSNELSKKDASDFIDRLQRRINETLDKLAVRQDKFQTEGKGEEEIFEKGERK